MWFNSHRRNQVRTLGHRQCSVRNITLYNKTIKRLLTPHVIYTRKQSASKQALTISIGKRPRVYIVQAAEKKHLHKNVKRYAESIRPFPFRKLHYISSILCVKVYRYYNHVHIPTCHHTVCFFFLCSI